jgi:hypothetical protein
MLYEGDWEQGERIIEGCERRSRDRRKNRGEVLSVKGTWLDFETQMPLLLFEERLGVVF